MAAESEETISDFVTQYSQNKYFYAEAARIASELCKSKLASNAIRAIVTHRAKQVNRLEAKLKERVLKRGKTYRRPVDIRNDIVDLAGVRIALYFPSDTEKIGKIIYSSFDVVKKVSYPEHGAKKMAAQQGKASATLDSSGSGFKQRFNGYLADHYRVKMRLDNLATQELRDDFKRSAPMIEIQVASVLMHAWQEVHHDLVYKTLTSGPASQEELRLLDATNGLVQSGEVLLQQLQIAVEKRVSYQEEPFSDQYELGSFLKAQRGLARALTDQLDILFEVLAIIGLNSPRKLGDLDALYIPTDDGNPVGLTLLDRILVQQDSEETEIGKQIIARPLDLSRIMIPKIILPIERSTGTEELETRLAENELLTIDSITMSKVQLQGHTLDTAIQVSDLLLYPNKSMLVMEDVTLTPSLKRFHEIHTDIISFRIYLRPVGEKDWKIPKKLLQALDLLWDWFETNEDILLRVSLKLARIHTSDIVESLTKVRPSTGVQRTSPIDPLIPVRHSMLRGESEMGFQPYMTNSSRSNFPMQKSSSAGIRLSIVGLPMLKSASGGYIDSFQAAPGFSMYNSSSGVDVHQGGPSLPVLESRHVNSFQEAPRLPMHNSSSSKVEADHPHQEPASLPIFKSSSGGWVPMARSPVPIPLYPPSDHPDLTFG